METLIRAAAGLDDETATATEFPETEDEELSTGLFDHRGKPIYRKPTRIKLGFDLDFKR